MKMDYEKLPNETDVSSEGEVEDSYVPQSFRRGTSWIQRLMIIWMSVVIVVETVVLAKFALKPRIIDPSLGLWCQ